MKARAEMAGNSFGSWMEENSTNEEYGVNVDGQVYTLASAPNSAIRSAVAAKMSASYLEPYRGVNRSFLVSICSPG